MSAEACQNAQCLLRGQLRHAQCLLRLSACGIKKEETCLVVLTVDALHGVLAAVAVQLCMLAMHFILQPAMVIVPACTQSQL